MAKTPPKQRSNGNGKGKGKSPDIPAKFEPGFISKLDGRTDIAKALRRNYEEIVTDIGELNEISHVKRSLIERFCWLEALLQTLEHEMATGQIDKTEAIGRWIQAVNSLSGLAKVLGVEKKIRPPSYNFGKRDEQKAQTT